MSVAGVTRRRLHRVSRLAQPSERTVLRAFRWLTAFAIFTANVAGTAIVFSLLVWVIPTGGDAPTIANLVLACSYVALAALLGMRWALRKVGPGRHWVENERSRPPTAEEQLSLLRAPLSVSFGVGVGWLLASFLFGGFNAIYSLELGARVFVTVLLAGLATAQIAYLLTEWLLRPVSARALAARPLEDPALPGVAARTMFTWGLASGVPMLGLAILGISTLLGQDLSTDQLAVAVLALTATALLVGFFATFISARVTADPIVSVRHAVAEVAEGNLGVEVPVYDGSELGMLQSGFNEMVGGLRERERIQEIFGRHVGEDVAREAVQRDGKFAGEVLEVGILFVDLTASTKLAASREPTEVVDLLNEFFGVVVEAVDSHGGWINKFEGDAALAVFGAPAELDDPAGAALAAGREMARHLASELEGVEAGIGVSYGEVVAGNIGAAKRFEYTVIGDAVNEASRLCDLAKERGESVLASAMALGAASAGERDRWNEGEEVELRGRTQPTRLATPGRG
ncbi:MAG: adenylate/guanylate cyclase domain-containing protein [Solirubrobacterales bacterium]|nr:adenylate/guanylate cyclase domain-containing protein [Solirubrobacterales bacterium]